MRRSARVLVVAAVVLAPGLLAPSARAQAVPIPVELSEWRISPSNITVTLGKEVRIWLFNNGSMNHSFVIEGYANYDSPIRPGRQVNASFTADVLGTYLMYCPIPGHRQAGMNGTFVIARPPPDTTVPPAPVAGAIALVVVSAVAAIIVVVLLRRRAPPDS